MARITPLFSGSSGNCIAIGGADSFVLIDVGVSAKRITDALRERDYDLSRLAGIFITHEHTDHITGLRVFASRTGVPVWATEGTLCALDAGGHLAGINARPCPIDGISAGGMHLRPLPTSHDTIESCGYAVNTADDRRAVIVTDTGVVSEELHRELMGCDLAYIESNHDVDMLQHGPYPPLLRQRILSERGHLSNEQCATEACAMLKSGTARFLLAHISQENNRPELAMQAVRRVLDACGARPDRDYTLQAVPRCGLPLLVF